MDIEKLGLEEIARLSIQEERNAIAFYTHLKSISSHPRGEILIGQIIRMEKGHESVLRQRFGKRLEIPGEEEARRIAQKEVDQDASELDILIKAMRSELEAAEMYKRGAEKAGDKKIKAIFEELVKDEENHFDILKGIYVQLTHREPEL